MKKLIKSHWDRTGTVFTIFGCSRVL